MPDHVELNISTLFNKEVSDMVNHQGHRKGRDRPVKRLVEDATKDKEARYSVVGFEGGKVKGSRLKVKEKSLVERSAKEERRLRGGLARIQIVMGLQRGTLNGQSLK